MVFWGVHLHRNIPNACSLPTCAPMWWWEQSVTDSGVGFLVFMYFMWTVLCWPDGDLIWFSGIVWTGLIWPDCDLLWVFGIVQTGLIWPDGDSLVFWYCANNFHLTRWWLDLVFIWPDPDLIWFSGMWTVFVRSDGDLICEQFWSDQMVTWFGWFFLLLYYVNILTRWGLGFLVLCEQFWSDQMVNGLQTESPVPSFKPPSNVTFVLCVLQARGDRSARVAASQLPPCRWLSASSNPSTSAGCMSPPRSVAAAIALNLPTDGVKLPAVAVKLLTVAVKLPAVAVKLHTVAVKHPAVAVKLSSSSCLLHTVSVKLSSSSCLFHAVAV